MTWNCCCVLCVQKGKSSTNVTKATNAQNLVRVHDNFTAALLSSSLFTLAPLLTRDITGWRIGP